MSSKITYNSLQVQQGKNKRPFRLSSISRGNNETWVNGELKCDWYHLYRYVDNGEIFMLHIDQYNKPVKKITDLDKIREKI